MMKIWGFLGSLTGFIFAFSCFCVTRAFADTVTYTPLLTAAMFDGPKADCMLAVNGVLLFVFIVLGLGLIMGVLKNR